MREKQKRRDRRNRIFLIGGSTLAHHRDLRRSSALVLINANKPAGPGPANMASDGIVLTGSDDGIKAVETDAIPAGGKPTPTDTDDARRQAAAHRHLHRLPLPVLQPVRDHQRGRRSSRSSRAASPTLEVHPIAILDRASLGTKYSSRAANAAGCVASYAPDKFLDVNDRALRRAAAENDRGPHERRARRRARRRRGRRRRGRSCVKDETFTGWVDRRDQPRARRPRPAGRRRQVRHADACSSTASCYTGAVDDAAAFQAFVAQAAVAADGDGNPDPHPDPGGYAAPVTARADCPTFDASRRRRCVKRRQPARRCDRLWRAAAADSARSASWAACHRRPQPLATMSSGRSSSWHDPCSIWGSRRAGFARTRSRRVSVCGVRGVVGCPRPIFARALSDARSSGFRVRSSSVSPTAALLLGCAFSVSRSRQLDAATSTVPAPVRAPHAQWASSGTVAVVLRWRRRRTPTACGVSSPGSHCGANWRASARPR